METPQVEVCVRGGVGRCCAILPDVCTIQDSQASACKVGGTLPRSAMRCLRCEPMDIDDGGTARGSGGAASPPNPAASAGFSIDKDGGAHDSRINVCGPATYARYHPGG